MTVALSIINNNFAGQAGLLLKDGVFVEDKDSPYVNLIVTREEKKEEVEPAVSKDFVLTAEVIDNQLVDPMIGMENSSP